jgi:two-component system, OmpR family, response regulator
MKNKLTILYVEDDPDIQEIAQLALVDVGGFVVTAFTNGHEAVIAAKNLRPDLLLLDVMMPDIDGPSTLENLRKLESCVHTPVIFMTAKVHPEEVSRYYDLGAVGVIQKPFDPMTLASEILQILERGKLAT